MINEIDDLNVMIVKGLPTTERGSPNTPTRRAASATAAPGAALMLAGGEGHGEAPATTKVFNAVLVSTPTTVATPTLTTRAPVASFAPDTPVTTSQKPAVSIGTSCVSVSAAVLTTVGLILVTSLAAGADVMAVMPNGGGRKATSSVIARHQGRTWSMLALWAWQLRRAGRRFRRRRATRCAPLMALRCLRLCTGPSSTFVRAGCCRR
ncbi:hypothetical protein BU14_0436s0004 [Porphyra umbilicalis]|uniref:Uncharacterized protein n=1 Tax=Porphyra umbilicalis TaxID=2786 RepID=A0A1X6NV21_PORUM|nr:hypothetical protein BU14_0436s0004 [Porphyra umbilicalis]|eukprot:OSX72432.1 hypothetical protein BU14_0436s0004 [Porphyra umbilicalis]